MRKKNNYMPVFDKSGSLNSGAYYYLKTGMIASVLTYYRIDVKKLYEGLVREYSISREQIIKHEGYHKAIEKCRIQAAYIQLSDTVILYMNTMQCYVEVFHNPSTKTTELEKIESIIVKHIKKITEEKKVGLIVTDATGALDVREFTITDMADDITPLYNDDFLEFNETLINKLHQNPSHGLVLLHGLPGTGKSSYIRHLIGKVKKNFIYLPSMMADHLAHPNFINFLTKHSNSILIIEDAEEVLMQRRAGSKSAIANLLNLSDGLLSDCLRISVIATFNTDIGKIDDAFLRKGRIIGRYCFEPLCTNKSNSLLRQLESLHETDQAMTLAEIFNHQDQDFGKMKNRNEIGFAMDGKGNHK